MHETTNELPAWFIKNKWYQFIYAAYSSGVVPGGGNSCSSGTDCLNLTTMAQSYNDREAVVLSSGMELSSQDRSSGLIGDYLESDNSDTDDAFEVNDISASFNDQLNTVSPSAF